MYVCMYMCIQYIYICLDKLSRYLRNLSKYTECSRAKLIHQYFIENLITFWIF